MPASLVTDWNIAPLNGLSQVKGRTDAALSDAPIHRFLLEAVERFADRPAVVFREQGIRWTWRAVRRPRSMRWLPACIALGLQRGRPRRHLVAEPRRVAGDAVRHRAHRR